MTGRPVLVGEMCPSAAADRPAVRPLFRRGAAWTDRMEAVASPVERHGARQFSVLGWDGQRAGLFSVVGAARVDGRVAAIGAYAGRSPCERARGAGGALGAREPDCVATLRDCGLAVAAIEPAGGFAARPVGEDPKPAEVEAGGACVADGKLLVDIDRDGELEAYPAAGFIDAAGAPADEVESVDAGSGGCEARFATRAVLAGSGAPGMGGMAVIGVADLDADGRHEIVAAFRQGGRETWALYSATATPARLDRVGVAMAWPGR